MLGAYLGQSFPWVETLQVVLVEVSRWGEELWMVVEVDEGRSACPDRITPTINRTRGAGVSPVLSAKAKPRSL